MRFLTLDQAKNNVADAAAKVCVFLICVQQKLTQPMKQVFKGITLHEYEALTKCWIQVFFQTSQGRVMCNQASSGLLSLNNIDRLSYLNNILIIKLPRPVHEAPLTELSHGFILVINSLLLNNELLHALVKMNFSLNSQDGKFEAMPNILLVLSRQSGRQLGLQVVYLGKCTFSQDQAMLEMKLQRKIEVHPVLCQSLVL